MSPRPRARVDKFKERRTLEDDLFFYFGIGPKENRFALRAKWFRRDDLLARWRAGSRPYCWWRLERDMEPPPDEEAYLREHGELDDSEEAELAAEKRLRRI
jgi:hypothetical protein